MCPMMITCLPLPVLPVRYQIQTTGFNLATCSIEYYTIPVIFVAIVNSIYENGVPFP